MSYWIASLVFWCASAGIVFAYAGYPVLMAFLARRRTPPANPTIHEWPTVSVVVVIYNEARRIRQRLENLATSDYPADRLEFIVVSDGSTDDSAEEVSKLRDARILWIPLPTRGGKALGLNAGVTAASGEVIVFADARQTFAPKTVRDLVCALHRPGVDAVSGELEIAPSAEGIGQGIDAYWRLERFLRKCEAMVDSCIGCTGAVYAIRRANFTPLPADTILDDVVIPMQIAVRGSRIGFCPQAKAFDPQPLAPEVEARRKRRTLAGNYQMLFRYPDWLLPWHNRLWWQLIAHKYLRIFAPALLVAAFVSNLFLLAHPFYRLTAILQCTFYGLALAGHFLKARIFSIPAGFVFLNVSVARAFLDYVRGKSTGAWSKAAESPK